MLYCCTKMVKVVVQWWCKLVKNPLCTIAKGVLQTGDLHESGLLETLFAG
jgi:hypothetical protein